MKITLCSSLEKIFPDSPAPKPFTSASCLCGERFSFQAVVYSEKKSDVAISVSSTLDISVRRVGFVPSKLPAYLDKHDADYISIQPGNFPDVLYPVKPLEHIPSKTAVAFWFTVEPTDFFGNHDISISFSSGKTETVNFMLTVLPVSLPKQKLICTQWFHSDCLAVHYGCEVFSDEYWRIVENFMRIAAKHGQNMILTPVFTPPLDTEIGGERPTVQLVKVIKSDSGYSFDFSLLDKWIDLSLSCGFEWFEISHLFTQWGALHAPKIMAYENGEYKRIFGWETDASSEEYSFFLKVFLSELVSYLKEKGIADRCFFHVSDEPNEEDIPAYKNALDIVLTSTKDMRRFDALSKYDFYQKGLVQTPVVSLNHIKPFLENRVSPLWAYYCCGQNKFVPNRFMAMPSYRSRILGTLLFKFDIEGFLQWGYNFWFTQLSKSAIDPYKVTDAGEAFPSGDSFVVYPDENGKPIESLRLVIFGEALQDMRALQLLADKKGVQYAKEFLDRTLGAELHFDEYPKNSDAILNMRAQLNKELFA